MFFYNILSVVIVAAVAAASTIPTQHEEAPRAQESTYFGDLRYVYKVYQECAAKDLTPCLKLKLISAMDRVARNYADLPIFEGLTFVRNNNQQAQENEIQTEDQLEATLPRTLSEKDSALNNIIADKISGFFDTHSIQMKLPSASELQRSFSEEGRKKKNKGSSMLLIPLILGGTLVPLALGALALLAGKALIVSKLALVLAAIIGLKKLVSGGHSSGHESGHDVVVSSGGGHGGGWGRSYAKEQAQNLAYNAYAPATKTR